MTGGVVVIGIGNNYRRDDGVGPALVDELRKRRLPGVRVMTSVGEPGELLDAWAGAQRAIVVDAAMPKGSVPGRIRRWSADDLEYSAAVVSSHELGLLQTYALGQVLRRLPEELIVITIDAADVSDGDGLTPAVAAALSEVVNEIVAEVQG